MTKKVTVSTETNRLVWGEGIIMITCEEYRDRNKKNAAYQEIATELGTSGKYRVDTYTC